MFRKLRRKFVITAMTALAIILAGLIAVINVANFVQATDMSDQLLEIIVEHDGSFPDVPPGTEDSGETGTKASQEQSRNTGKPSGTGEEGTGAPEDTDAAAENEGPPETERPAPGDPSVLRQAEAPFTTRYFWVKLDADGKVMETDVTHIAAVSKAQAEELAESVSSSGREKGYAASYYRFLVQYEEDGGKMIVFKDCSADIMSAGSLLRNSLLLMTICLALMFLLVRMLAGRAVTPAVESMGKQKQFITDAGHELKTPLAVISADVDVLELDHGKSEWTQSIRNQCRRMTELVQNMLTLSRMEEENSRLIFTEIDLSSVLRETAEGFRTAAEAAGKRYEIQIEDGVHINGERSSMIQLLSVLIDNAIKYSDAEGNILVRMKRGRQIELEVSNTSDRIPDGNLDRLFDRFYRADASRNRKTGGFGIGLSAARAVAERYGGTIRAVRDGEHTIRFLVNLPKNGAPAQQEKRSRRDGKGPF